MNKRMDAVEIVAVLIVCGIGFAMQYFFIMEHHDRADAKVIATLFPLFLFAAVARSIMEVRREGK